MITRENILELESRRKIYNFILKYPGLHLRELSRKLNIPIGSLTHHLHFLEKQELVTTKSDRRYLRYYVSKKVGRYDKEFLNLLRQEVPLRIVLLLLSSGPGDVYKKGVAGPYSNGEINPEIFLKTYSKKELVELTKYWKKPFDDLFQLNKHRTTIDFHLNKLLDSGIIEKISIGKEVKYKLKDEDAICAFLVKYQKILSNKLIDKMLGWSDYWVEKRINSIIEIVLECFPPFLPFPIN